MTINKLGNYELPLSDEERTKLISFLGDLKTRDLLSSVSDMLAVKVPHLINLSILYFNRNYQDIKEEVKNRFSLLRIVMKEQFPMIPVLSEELLWTFEIKVDGDNIPRIQLNDWLNEIISKKVVLPVDLSKVSDEEWICYFKRHKNAFPDMVKISPEMNLIIEFNNKLNELNDVYFDVDYTEVIEQIIKAAKEGKL